MKNYLSQGVHCICDIHNVSNNLLNDGELLELILVKACKLSGATVLNISKHKFEPAGWTIQITLSESHASIHTYVDLNNKDGLGEIFLDMFTCGKKCSPEIGVTYIISQLRNEKSNVNVKVLKRGLKGGIVDISEMCEIMC